MRWMVLTAGALAVAACGGGGGPTPTADAPLTVVDGVIIFPDAPTPDATSATTGAFQVTMQCGGAGCGKMGGLHLSADDCNKNPIANKFLPGKTLTAGVDIDTTIDSLVPGMYCATAYLDVDNNFAISAGDVVAAAAAAQVTVVAGDTATATIVLDTISP